MFKHFLLKLLPGSTNSTTRSKKECDDDDDDGGDEITEERKDKKKNKQDKEDKEVKETNRFNLLQLPTIVIQVILGQVDLYSDKICLYATCHRLFSMRQRVPNCQSLVTSLNGTNPDSLCFYLPTQDFDRISKDRDFYFNNLQRLVINTIKSPCDFNQFKSLRHLQIDNILSTVELIDVHLPSTLVSLVLGGGGHFILPRSRVIPTTTWLPQGLNKLIFNGLAPQVIFDSYSQLPSSLRMLEGTFIPLPIPIHLEKLYCHGTTILNIKDDIGLSSLSASISTSSTTNTTSPTSTSTSSICIKLKKVFLKYYTQDIMKHLPITLESLHIKHLGDRDKQNDNILIPYDKFPNLHHFSVPEIPQGKGDQFLQLPQNIRTIGVYSSMIMARIFWYDFCVIIYPPTPNNNNSSKEQPSDSSQQKRYLESFESALKISQQLIVLRKGRHRNAVLEFRKFDQNTYLIVTRTKTPNGDTKIKIKFEITSNFSHSLLHENCKKYCGYIDRR